MWENSEFRMRLEEDTIAEHEKIMLSSGQCEYFMPMGFLSDGGEQTVCYDCSGFAPLASYRIERTEDALYLLERTLLIIGNSVEYLITPSRIRLSRDTVFYNKDTGQVKIAYIPETKENCNLRNHLVAFIGELKQEITDGREEYLTQTARLLYYKNYHIKDIVNQVAVFKRKIYAEQVSE